MAKPAMLVTIVNNDNMYKSFILKGKMFQLRIYYTIYLSRRLQVYGF